MLGCALSGCGLFYENSYRGPCFTLYSDHGDEFLTRVGRKVERIYDGYGGLFGLEGSALGRTRIVLDGSDSDVLDYGYTPSILGYYVPFLNYICIDTVPASTRSEEMLDQVLLHEVAHHFIVTEFPGASSQCWLNEGLAGALEVSVFDANSFECPLVNPLLFQIAQGKAFHSSERPSLRRLTAMRWGEFHQRESKERNYALAWALVYFLLEHHLPRTEPLGRRMEALYRMDRSAIARLEPEWLKFLRSFDMTGTLVQLAQDPNRARPLSARWATRQLGAVRVLDEPRILDELTALFDDADPEKRALALVGFIQKVERVGSTSFVLDPGVQRGVDRVAGILSDPGERLALRECLAVAMGDNVKTRDCWLRSLIGLLDGGEESLRAASAQTLSKIAGKRTIVNPAFWRSAPLYARRSEVAEWEAWLTREESGRGAPRAGPVVR